MTSVHAPPTAREGRLWPPWLRTKTLFYFVILVVLAAYTQMAFDLEWRTAAGRIGPGFFPRIIGVLGMTLTLMALVQTLRAPAEDDDCDTGDADDLEAGEADLGRHPMVFGAMVAGGALFLITLTTLGAILSSVIFMFGMLALLNRGRWFFNTALSLLLPLALYLLFQTFLNAGLPDGVLPRF